jgi:Phage QLRG family, putative DNA packaging.
MADEVKIEDSILGDFKTLKGIKNDEMDDVFKIYINQAMQEVELYIGRDTLPDVLKGIITQMAEAKFTKAGQKVRHLLVRKVYPILITAMILNSSILN